MFHPTTAAKNPQSLLITFGEFAMIDLVYGAEKACFDYALTHFVENSPQLWNNLCISC